MVKEELCEMVIDVKKVGDRVMAVVLIYGYAPQSGGSLG